MKALWIVLALGGVGALALTRGLDVGAEEAPAVSDAALFRARRGDLVLSVAENGYLKAKNSEMLKPKFNGQGEITWLVDEGTEVEEGALLVEFDKTEVQNQIDELENSLIQYEIELEAARADLGIQERDNTSGIEKAELALELARLELERYEQGDAPNQRRKNALAVEKGESELRRAKERFEQVPELEAQGFMTRSQVEEERIRLREAEISLETAAEELALFDEYTKPMELTRKKSEVQDAERELQNAREKAGISLKERQARVAQKERQVQSTKVRLEQLAKEVEQRSIRSPRPGIVHYGDPARPWMRDQIQVGNSVRQGNTVITLPDLTVMQVLIQVHEAEIDQVEEGLPVLVTVETRPGKAFRGSVTEIASVASSNNWTDEANRTFRVEVTMDPTEDPLRAGVTARAEIQVRTLEDVLHVPLHAVLPEGEGHLVHVLGAGGVERRSVQVGEHNAHYVAVLGGLEEGERVLLYDPRAEGVDAAGEDDADGEGDEDADGPAEALAGAGGPG